LSVWSEAMNESLREKLESIFIDPAYRFFMRISHVIGWIPVIWRDYDWDHEFLYIIMREKMRRMRLNHERVRLIADWEKVAGELRECEGALGRLIEDDYARERHRAHREKFGDSWSRSTDVINPDGSVTVKFQDIPGERDDFLRIMEEEEAERIADLKLVAKHFVENSRGWWD
jgi:hypothetical protein